MLQEPQMMQAYVKSVLTDKKSLRRVSDFSGGIFHKEIFIIFDNRKNTFEATGDYNSLYYSFNMYIRKPVITVRRIGCSNNDPLEINIYFGKLFFFRRALSYFRKNPIKSVLQ